MKSKAGQDEGNVILFIPTLATRSTLLETVESVIPHAACFDLIVISVNGDKSDADKVVSALSKCFDRHPAIDPVILTTNAHVSPIKHLKYVSRLFRKYSADSLLFLLADDDLIVANAHLRDYIDIAKQNLSSTVGIGNMRSFSKSHRSTIKKYQCIDPGESVSPETLLQREASRIGHINMSTMIIPVRIFLDVARYMINSGSDGRRFEYMTCAHRDVRFVVCPSHESVLIRDHPSRESSLLSHESWVRDELIFFVWVWLNNQKTRPWIRGSAVYGITLRRFATLAKELLDINIMKIKFTPIRQALVWLSSKVVYPSA